MGRGPSDGTSHQHALDHGDRRGMVEVIGTVIDTIHDRVATDLSVRVPKVVERPVTASAVVRLALCAALRSCAHGRKSGRPMRNRLTYIVSTE